MRRIRRVAGGIERQHLVLVSLAVLVALAGCSGLGTGDDNETAANATTTPGETPTPAENDSDPSNGTNGSEADSYEFGTGLDSELTPPDQLSVTGDEVVNDTLAAENDTEEYHVSSTMNVTNRQNNVQRSQEVDGDLAVDRAERKVRSTQQINVSGQQVSQTSYLVNGTFYQNSEALAAQYNSEWIKQNISENYSEQFRVQDELAVHRALLTNGTVTLEGAQDVDGERTYRLRVESNGSAFADFFGFGETGDNDVDMTTVVWVDAETGEIVRSEGRMVTETTSRGQTVTSVITFLDHFEYSEVDITLPEESDTAVEIDQNGTVVE